MDMYIERSYFDEVIGRDRVQRALAPYFAWVEKLSEPLSACCHNLIGAEIEHSNLVNLPFLLGECFGLDPDAPEVRQMVAANALMLTYFLASDRLLDAPESAHRFTILLATQIHAELLRCYDKVAPGHAAEIWSTLVSDHVTGVIQEEDHHASCRRGGPALDSKTYEHAMVLKNRYGSAAIGLLAAATGRLEPEPILQQVYDQISIEIEFDDDLKDWREDLASGRFTLFGLELRRAATSLDPDALSRALTMSGVVPAMLETVSWHLARAAQLLAAVDFPCVLLMGWISRHSEANEGLKAKVVDRQVRFALSRAIKQPDPERAPACRAQTTVLPGS